MEVVDKLTKSLDELLERESDLLIQDAHEDSITGRLIKYLATFFCDFEHSIDTQYDKRILENRLVKKEADFLIHTLPLHKWPRNWDDNQINIKKEILPDIIFHDRQSSKHNFMIIEIKKSTNTSKADREWDILKLSEMTKRELNYEYGVFIDLTTGIDFQNNPSYSFKIFQKGDMVFEA